MRSKFLRLTLSLFLLFVLFVGNVSSDVAISPQSLFLPTDVPGCVLWLRSDLGVTKDGSNLVSVWVDQSGDGNDATQVTSDNQPLWKDNHINGHPAIYFDGVDNFLLASGIATKGYFSGNDKPFTIFIVSTLEKAAWDDDGNWISCYLASDSFSTGIFDVLDFYNYGMSVRTALTDDMSVTKGSNGGTGLLPGDYNLPYIWELVFDGQNVSIFKNATTIINNADLDVGVVTPDDSFSIGCAYEGLGVAKFAFWLGDIDEVIVYKSLVSVLNRSLIENYLNGRYAIY